MTLRWRLDTMTLSFMFKQQSQFQTFYTVLNWILSVSWVVVIILMLIDSVGSKQTTLVNLGISASWIAVSYAVISTVIRLTLGSKIEQLLVSSTLYFVIPVSLVLGIILSIFEFLTPDNYVYSLTRLNPEILVALSHLGMAVVVISSSIEWLKKHGKFIIWFAPIWLMVVNQWTHILPFDVTVFFTQEDGPIETIQNLIILATFSLTLYESWQAKINNQKRRFYTFLLLTGLLFFVGMEEISWGQRIFGTQTPEKLKAINVQDETNIHNIGIFNQLQAVGYIFISGVAFVLPLFQKLKLIRKNTWFPPQVTSWYMAIPIFTFVYNLFSTNYFIHGEVIEVLFYGGLMSWVASQSKFSLKQLQKQFK